MDGRFEIKYSTNNNVEAHEFISQPTASSLDTFCNSWQEYPKVRGWILNWDQTAKYFGNPTTTSVPFHGIKNYIYFGFHCKA